MKSTNPWLDALIAAAGGGGTALGFLLTHEPASAATIAGVAVFVLMLARRLWKRRA